MPGAMIANKFGATWTMVAGLLSSALLNLIAPPAVSVGGAYTLVAIRALNGALHGGTWAGLAMILAAWVPKCERSTLVAFAYTGLSVVSYTIHIE